MKKIIFSLLRIGLLATACAPAPNVGAINDLPYVDTGVDTEAWATVPAGDFPSGQQDHLTYVDEFQIMITDVTVEQYANYLNDAIASGDVTVGDFVVKAAEEVSFVVEGAGGYYEGDPFDAYKHEEEIEAGDKLFAAMEEGLRMTYDGSAFAAMDAYVNHPMTMVTWWGANAYCEYYDTRLPLDLEWEKAARGTEIDDAGHGRPFAWGDEIHGNFANYYSSADLFEKMYGKLGNTTPVGFYNGQTYEGYETHDAVSPYGLYDMGGNVWQWLGDDIADQHYRHMRGGSFYTYEVDLRVWKFNSAGPQHYAPEIGFRCAK